MVANVSDVGLDVVEDFEDALASSGQDTSCFEEPGSTPSQIVANNVAWDPSGERFAVSYERLGRSEDSSDEWSNVIGLYVTGNNPSDSSLSFSLR